MLRGETERRGKEEQNAFLREKRKAFGN